AELFAGYEADEEAFENLRCGRKVTLDTLKRRPTAGRMFFSGRLIVSSDRNFSLCAPEACGGTWALVPEVNIIFRGEDE
ncbi:MAG: hypothetical protein HUJ86_03105, partial [Synergistes sp.]|nr:hypothetical protein [Synergistes sp.]